MARVEHVPEQLLEPAEKVLRGDQQRPDKLALLKRVLILYYGSREYQEV
jgi:hypothetical protein